MGKKKVGRLFQLLISTVGGLGKAGSKVMLKNWVVIFQKQKRSTVIFSFESSSGKKSGGHTEGMVWGWVQISLRLRLRC